MNFAGHEFGLSLEVLVGLSLRMGFKLWALLIPMLEIQTLNPKP